MLSGKVVEKEDVYRAVNSKGEVVILEGEGNVLTFDSRQYFLSRVSDASMPVTYRVEDDFRFEDPPASKERGFEDSRVLLLRGTHGVDRVVFYNQAGGRKVHARFFEAHPFAHVTERREYDE